MQKDHQCGIVIAKGLPPHQGNATWEIDENVPQATYFVRAYSVCGSTVCAFGNSTGFFQVGITPSAGPFAQQLGRAVSNVESAQCPLNSFATHT